MRVSSRARGGTGGGMGRSMRVGSVRGREMGWGCGGMGMKGMRGSIRRIGSVGWGCIGGGMGRGIGVSLGRM
jgi:hypothetical protein